MISYGYRASISVEFYEYRLKKGKLTVLGKHTSVVRDYLGI